MTHLSEPTLPQDLWQVSPRSTTHSTTDTSATTTEWTNSLATVVKKRKLQSTPHQPSTDRTTFSNASHKSRATTSPKITHSEPDLEPNTLAHSQASKPLSDNLPKRTQTPPHVGWCFAIMLQEDEQSEVRLASRMSTPTSRGFLSSRPSRASGEISMTFSIIPRLRSGIFPQRKNPTHIGVGSFFEKIYYIFLNL